MRLTTKIPPNLKKKLIFLSASAGLFAPWAAQAVDVPYSKERINLPPSSGNSIQAEVRVPQGLKPGEKVPALLVFGGFESAGKVLDLLNAPGKVALGSFDYPFHAPRKFSFPQSLSALPEAKRLYPETTRAIRALVHAVRNHPQIDPAQVYVVGASFGSPFAVAAAAENPETAGLVLVHGFGKIPETAEHVILRSWLPRYGWIARPMAWFLSRTVWLYLGAPSPEESAQKLLPHQRVLMITAANDSFIPKGSSDALWEALKKSSAQSLRLMMPTDHLMPGSDQLIEQIILHVQEWMQSPSNGAPSAHQTAFKTPLRLSSLSASGQDPAPLSGPSCGRSPTQDADRGAG